MNTKLQKPLMIVLSIFVVILANLLISKLSWRIDASYGKAYTLSSSSKKILKSLPETINITFFVSSDLPTRLKPLKDDVIALLQEYKRDGKNIRLTTVDPKSSSEAAKSAKDFNIPELQFSQLEQDKYAVTTAYFGIGIASKNNKQSIPQVADINTLEYNITSAIYKLTRTDIPRIGIVNEGPAFGQDPYQSLKDALNRQFTVDSLSTATDSAVLAKSKALLLLDDNTKTYDSAEITALKKYLIAGGNAILFADGVWVNTQTTFDQAVTPAGHGLFGLTRDLGISVDKDLTLSASSEIVNFNSHSGAYLAQYPLWVRTQNVNKKSSYFTGVTQLTFPWVASLELINSKIAQVTPLIETSSQSWTQQPGGSVDPQNIPQPKTNQLKTLLITAEARTAKGGRLLVVPSSRFAQDAYLAQGSDNLAFVINVLNDYASAGALSGIRSRTVNIYPLPDIPASQKDFFKYLNMLLLPALFGVYGMWRLLRRR